MSDYFLQLNDKKSEVVLFGPHLARTQIVGNLGHLFTNVKPTARNLGVFFDLDPNLELHVKKIVKTCLYQLRNIAKINHFISVTELEKVIHAFISSRLDNCNSLYTCLSQKSLHQLQLV